AAIRQVDGEDRAAAVLDRAAAMIVELLVVVRADVAPRERFFQVLEERRIDRHHVFEVPVDRAVLDHDDLAVLLGDSGFDLAHLLVEKNPVILLAVDDRLARGAHAVRAERVGFARPAKRRLYLLPRFLQREIRPLRSKRAVGLEAVERIEGDPGALRRQRQGLLRVLNRLVHALKNNPQVILKSGTFGEVADSGGEWAETLPWLAGPRQRIRKSERAFACRGSAAAWVGECWSGGLRHGAP